MIETCVSCNGVYAAVQLDGSRYFHKCPSSVTPANVRDENVPSTNAPDAGKLISPGKGLQPTAVVPATFQPMAAM